MKQPQDEIGSTRKTLPARKARKTSAAKKQPKHKIAERKRVLKKGSDWELIKAFGEK